MSKSSRPEPQEDRWEALLRSMLCCILFAGSGFIFSTYTQAIDAAEHELHGVEKKAAEVENKARSLRRMRWELRELRR